MLRFEGLEKYYGDKTVFVGLGHCFEAGCHALQSPNGSGKSTLLGILTGVIPADRGEVWIAGMSLQRDPLGAKSRLAYVPDACPVYPFLTGREFLELVASTKKTRLSRATLDLVTRLGLTSHLDLRFEQMSLGTRKKMMLAASSIGEPAVLVADEPSIAVDDAARHVLIDYFKSVAASAVVLFSTHDDDFARACDARVVGMPELVDRPRPVTESPRSQDNQRPDLKATIRTTPAVRRDLLASEQDATT
jgi:ABC-2 type transport system ATP-binding protein